jgi:serine O-acetyltransferase
MSTDQTALLERPVCNERITLLSQLREDLACVFERDPAARTCFEVLTTYPGLHAILVHRIAHRLWRRNFRYLARFLAFVVRSWTHIEIHPGATIGRRFFIDHGCGVVIGETAEVGDDVTLYHGVTLGGTSWSKGKRHPTLEDGVVVGAGAKILGPITVGERCRVGANSVVIADVPARRTVVGIPARVVRHRGESRPNPYGVDLNHHLIPDPVASAISCLLERIRILEQRQAGSGAMPVEDCDECNAMELCETATPASGGVSREPTRG